MGAKDNLAVRLPCSCWHPGSAPCSRARAGSDSGRGSCVLKCGEVLGNSAKSRGSSSISPASAFLQRLVVVVDVVLRPTEGGAPDEPAVEVGERLMLADRARERRRSYMFAGETLDDPLAIGREQGTSCELVSIKGGCWYGSVCAWIGIACGGLP
jgi:hypothetical protein